MPDADEVTPPPTPTKRAPSSARASGSVGSRATASSAAEGGSLASRMLPLDDSDLAQRKLEDLSLEPAARNTRQSK